MEGEEGDVASNLDPDAALALGILGLPRTGPTLRAIEDVPQLLDFLKDPQRTLPPRLDDEEVEQTIIDLTTVRTQFLAQRRGERESFNPTPPQLSPREAFLQQREGERQNFSPIDEAPPPDDVGLIGPPPGAPPDDQNDSEGQLSGPTADDPGVTGDPSTGNDGTTGVW